MRINKENIVSEKGGLSFLQVIILVVGIFAFAYLLSSAFESVSAQATEIKGLACCEKTKEGAYCQYGLEESCDKDFKTAPTQCEYVDYCKEGCCYSTKTGWCNKATPQLLCSEKWVEDKNCNIPECSRGCCVIGRNALFTTERNCEVKSSFFGLAKDFRPEIKTELECIFLAEKDDEGACVYGESCIIDTKENCKNKGGDFYKGKYCSDTSLNTECKAHDKAGCFEQKVYWFDSCGNREEVKEECSIFAGTMCGLVGTDHKCKSLSCEVTIDGKQVTKKNGESWCEYEGTIGKGRDVPGSRHIRHICFMGEERVEPCQDYRNQICVQSDTPLNNGTEKGAVFTEAACRINNWRVCLDYNTETDKTKMQEKCKINPDCFVNNVYVSEYFQFPFCAPAYPPGFDLTNENGGRNAEMVCAMGNQKCTAMYVKDIGGWDCQANCNCQEAIFAEQMNNLCTSLGDCGAYTNLAGEVTDDGYGVTGDSHAPKLSADYLKKLKEFAKTIQGQKAQPGNFSSLFGDSTTPPDEGYGASDSVTGEGLLIGGAFGLLTISGAMGTALTSGVVLTSGAIVGAISQVPIVGQVATGIVSAGTGAIGSTTGGVGSLAGGTGTVAAGTFNPVAFANGIGAGIGAAAGTILAMYLFGEDLPPNAALITSIASSVVGTIAGVQSAAVGTQITLTGILQAAFAAFVWAFIIAIIIIVIMKLVGIGDTKEKVVNFQCLPWQPPLGGADCDKCNDRTGCSEYTCKSLGQTCGIINKGTEDQKCVNIEPQDAASPRITPLYGTMTAGFEYRNVKEGVGFELKEVGGDCIPEFTNVLFGIQTDKPAQCAVGADPLKTFDEMKGNYFGGSNLYLENHTNILAIPSLEILAREYNLTPIEVKKLGEINMYVKCKGINGKENDAAYVIKSCVKEGPDLTKPYVTHASPPNLSYIAINASKINATFYVNEPANCKYSLSEGRYEDMPNSMECKTGVQARGKYGWPCNTNLDVSSVTKFYVRCQDLSENNNTMTESYVYELQRSASELRIILIDPENGETIRAQSEPTNVNLEVVTAGGAEDGKATCYYKFGNDSWPIKFLETYSNKHKQVFNSLMSGDYKIWVECEDIAGNKVMNSTEFTVYVDTGGPVITRVYYQNGLKIATDEDSTCAYSFVDSKCSFNIKNITETSNAELMTGTGKEHTTEWQAEQTYYIKCMDEYGNQPGRCSMVARPYDLLK